MTNDAVRGEDSSRLKPELIFAALVVAGFLWGWSFPLTKMLTEAFPPITLAALRGLDLEPTFVAVGTVVSIGVLRHDAFPIQLGGVFKHLLPVPGQVLGVDDGKPDVVLPEKVGEHSLALHLGKFAEIAVSLRSTSYVVRASVFGSL